MTLLLQGVGIGLFLLVGIWLAALFVCFVSAHSQKNLGTYAVSLAVILTLILVFIPRDSEKPSEAVDKIYDTLFLWRIALVLLLGVSALGGAAFYLFNHLMESRAAHPIKKWNL